MSFFLLNPPAARSFSSLALEPRIRLGDFLSSSRASGYSGINLSSHLLCIRPPTCWREGSWPALCLITSRRACSLLLDDNGARTQSLPSLATIACAWLGVQQAFLIIFLYLTFRVGAAARRLALVANHMPAVHLWLVGGLVDTPERRINVLLWMGRYMYDRVMSGCALASIHPAPTWSMGVKVEHIAVHDMTRVLGAMVFLQYVLIWREDLTVQDVSIDRNLSTVGAFLLSLSSLFLLDFSAFTATKSFLAFLSAEVVHSRTTSTGPGGSTDVTSSAIRKLATGQGAESANQARCQRVSVVPSLTSHVAAEVTECQGV